MTDLLKTHLALNVSDLDRSVSFYTSFFGQSPAKLRGDYAKFELDDPPLNFTLNVGKPAGAQACCSPQGINHLGIQVASTEAVTAAAERLAAAGLDLREERGVDCCYARQDKVWAEDPDGHPWEVFVVTQADTGEAVAGAAVEASACCVGQAGSGEASAKAVACR